MQIPAPLFYLSSTNQESPKMVKTNAAASSSETAVKYKGVRLRKWGKYVSEIRLPNCRDRIWLGSYDTAEKAARAFDAALFCLRGPAAKFNFPDDPPSFGGAAHTLSPAEIQAMAQHYANTTSGGSGCPSRPETSITEDADISTSEGPIDWSFLDMLDGDDRGNAGHVMDFGLFHEPGDMYMPLPPHVNYDNFNDEENENNGNVTSFLHLWNF